MFDAVQLAARVFGRGEHNDPAIALDVELDRRVRPRHDLAAIPGMNEEPMQAATAAAAMDQCFRQRAVQRLEITDDGFAFQAISVDNYYAAHRASDSGDAASVHV